MSSSARAAGLPSNGVPDRGDCVLLISQSDHRVDICRTSRRDQASSKRNEDQQRADNHNGHGIVGAYVVQHGLQIPRHAKRHSDAGHSPNECQHKSLLHHKPQNIASLRAKRGANPDFARAPRHLIRQQTVKPDARQRQRQQAKETGQPRDQPLLEQ